MTGLVSIPIQINYVGFNNGGEHGDIIRYLQKQETQFSMQ